MIKRATCPFTHHAGPIIMNIALCYPLVLFEKKNTIGLYYFFCLKKIQHDESDFPQCLHNHNPNFSFWKQQKASETRDVGRFSHVPLKFCQICSYGDSLLYPDTIKRSLILKPTSKEDCLPAKGNLICSPPPPIPPSPCFY